MRGHRFISLRFFPLLFCLLCAGCGLGKPAPVIDYGVQGGGATSAGVHTATAADTVWSIAERYDIDMKDIIYVNRLSPPYALEAGQRLALPPPMRYRVREGETLYDVSRTFNVSMTQLAHQNRLAAPYRIGAGDILRLPSARPEYAANPQVAAARARNQSGAIADGPAVAIVPVEPVQTVLAVPSANPPLSSPVALTPPRPAGESFMVPPAAGGAGRFAWPVDGSVISTYGPKKDGTHNDGINIRIPKGAPVRAAENGVVVYADDELGGFGNLVLIRHADRWMTAYAHLDRIAVSKGQQVGRGGTIGTAGQTGGVDSPQLHFEVRRGTEALNPLLYLARQGS